MEVSVEFRALAASFDQSFFYVGKTHEDRNNLAISVSRLGRAQRLSVADEIERLVFSEKSDEELLSTWHDAGSQISTESSSIRNMLSDIRLHLVKFDDCWCLSE